MTKILDRTAQLQGQPGLHALIAGVSLYAHLPGGGGAPGELGNLLLAQLDGTARTAHVMVEWLLEADQQGRLPLPLATVRLLLSPSADEAALNGVVESCTWENFATELNAWRADAAKHPKSMTFFYFAGHGLERWKGDSVMLMADFAKPGPGGVFDRAIDTKHIIEGMAPPTDPARTIARNQLYFVDACRTSVSALKKYKTEEARRPWAAEANGKDDRSYPIFYASVPGDTAKLLKGQTTLFSEALLNCLNRLGATGPAPGNPKWHVTTRTLGDALEIAVAQVNEKYKKLGASQNFMPDGQNKSFTIVNLNAPPEVDVEVTVDPEDAIPAIGIDIRDKQLRQVRFIQPDQAAHPYRGHLPAGIYKFAAAPIDPAAAFQVVESLESVTLPSFPWVAKVTP